MRHEVSQLQAYIYFTGPRVQENMEREETLLENFGPFPSMYETYCLMTVCLNCLTAWQAVQQNQSKNKTAQTSRIHLPNPIKLTKAQNIPLTL